MLLQDRSHRNGDPRQWRERQQKATAAPGDRSKTIEFEQSTRVQHTMHEASRNASYKQKTATSHSKALNSTNDTGASTEQGAQTINKSGSPPPIPSPHMSSFPSPDMKSKKQMLRDYHANAGRLTITTGAKKRPTGADGKGDSLIGASEFTEPSGAPINRVQIVNPQTSKDFGSTFERSASPMGVTTNTLPA